MKLFLSTSWISSRVTRGRDLVDRMKAVEVEGVELDYRIPEPIFPDVVRALKRSGLAVSSVHNFCPFPLHGPRGRGGGNLFDLASTDREERREAVSWTTRTLEHAVEVEAPVVVLHCGEVVMDPELDKIFSLVEEKGREDPEYRKFLEEKLDERKRKRDRHLDALLGSLDRLARRAERLGVALALENRAHYHELPDPDECRRVLRELEGAPLGYWHDVGHAHLHALVGVCGFFDPYERLKDACLGVHVHDARGRNDHLPPGEGEIDLAAVVEAIRRDIPWVVELKPGTREAAVRYGLEHLRRLWEESGRGRDEKAGRERARETPTFDA